MSDKPTENSRLERQISRRELLKKSGQVGAAAAVAGSLAGPAAGATRNRALTAKKVPTGGTVNWAIEVDPGNIAPFGQTAVYPWIATEVMYESLLAWDPKLNIVPSLATSYDVINPKQINWNLRQGVQWHNGTEFTADDVVYSFGLQANPPLPGTTAVLGQFPAIKDVSKISKYKVRMDLSAPDARVYGYLAWNRYSSIVPNGMYQSLNPSTTGIGTGPFKVSSPFVDNQGISYVKNTDYWKPGLPYLDGINYKIITDEQARIAALEAGQLDGANISPTNAVALNGHTGLTVLHNLTAAFRELQMTVKAGDNKPWADVRVRQAVNLAINRQNLINKVYAGYGQDSGHVAAGYGAWTLTEDELQTTYEKQDLPTAKSLMKAAGQSGGFSVNMTTYATPADYTAMAALMQNDLDQIGITLNIVPQDPVTFAANNSAGSFDWDLTARGMRGDVDGFVAEFNPSAAIYSKWFTGWQASPGQKTKPIWTLVGDGRIQLNTQKRLPMYQSLDKDLLTQLVEIPLIAVSTFQVLNNKLKNMYVAYTGFNTGLKTAYFES
jgi:peptide/nickel transport system substrate-binding protein